MKRSLNALLLLTLFAFCFSSAAAQIKMTGDVVEFVDAKTVIVQVPAGRLTVELQYIDVPEPQQALHTLVSNHVRQMLLGKAVEIQTKGFNDGKATSKLFLGGVDVSQQLLRDGAAWHMPSNMSGQSSVEFSAYAEAESLAKKEKRGVWSIPNLRPGWQLRAEDAQAKREAEDAARRDRKTLVGVSEYRTDTRGGGASSASSTSTRSQMDAWVSVFAGAGKEGPGIRTYNDPNGRAQTLFTSSVVVDFSSPGQKEKLEVAAGHVTLTTYTGARIGVHLIAFRAIAQDFRFSTTKTQMTALIDGKAVNLGVPFTRRAQGMIGGGEVASEEVMYFKTSAATLRSISKAKKVELRINRLSGTLPAESRDLFGQLADATTP